MKSMRQQLGHLSAQLLIFIFIIALVVLGLIGLVLPIIPGLLFLAIAAILLAPYVPALSDWMRRSPVMSRYIDDAERLHSLELPDKLKLGFFLSLRMLIDSTKFVFGFVKNRFDDFESRQRGRSSDRSSHQMDDRPGMNERPGDHTGSSPY